MQLANHGGTTCAGSKLPGSCRSRSVVANESIVSMVLAKRYNRALVEALARQREDST
jgi:hypothetical protein